MDQPEAIGLEKVAALLRRRGRYDLAAVLSRSYVVFDVSTTFGSYYYSQLTTAEIYAPVADYESLKSLSPEDNECVLEAMLEIWPPRAQDMEITGIVYRLDTASLMESQSENEAILGDLDRLRSILIAVSTGGPRINDVNEDYKAIYSQLGGQLKELALKNPIPYTDLWDWYGKWSSGDFPSYKSRREHIRSLLEPLEGRLREGTMSREAEVFDEPTGWTRVDLTLGDIRSRLETASTEMHFQSVGHLCREALISLAQVVFIPEQHPPVDGEVVDVSETDAKRMLDRYLAKEMGGKSRENARRYAKASLALANELQHKRTAEFRDAALCAQATASVVNIIAILSGLRDPIEGE